MTTIWRRQMHQKRRGERMTTYHGKTILISIGLIGVIWGIADPNWIRGILGLACIFIGGISE